MKKKPEKLELYCILSMVDWKKVVNRMSRHFMKTKPWDNVGSGEQREEGARSIRSMTFVFA